MIDSVELLCNLNPTDWTNNKNLSFYSLVNTTTGEIQRNNKHANINGIHLSIKEGKEIYCNVRGSLPKYYTKGETNSIDYSFNDFLATCKQLKRDLGITANESTLHGFEFGVNIKVLGYVDEVLACIKFFRKHTFGQYVEKGKRLGIIFKFQQYCLKIYDKVLQETGKKSQLMRFEISIDKMEWVKHLGIKTLTNLQSQSVWAELSKILLKAWADIVFVDELSNYKSMTNQQQKKYLRFLDANYWAKLNRNVFDKAKKDLNKLQDMYCINENAKQTIYNLILNKCKLLSMEYTFEIGDNLTDFLEQKNMFENPESRQHSKNQNWRQINHLDKGLKTLPNPPSFLTETDLENKSYNLNNEIRETTANNCECMNCKKVLKEKKATAKFCTDKCRKAFHERERTKANQKKRLKEQEQLEKVINNLQRTNLSLLVIYRADGLQYADQLNQKEISVSSEWISQIEKVLIISNESKTQIEFTSLRAKKLIREIAKLNRN